MHSTKGKKYYLLLNIANDNLKTETRGQGCRKSKPGISNGQIGKLKTKYTLYTRKVKQNSGSTFIFETATTRWLVEPSGLVNQHTIQSPFALL